MVTRDEDRRGRARERFPEVQLLDDAAELWADAESFDLVVVAAPNRFHASLAETAVGAGLPVVVDKPFARSAAEARELLAAAAAAGVAAIPFQNRRWDGDFLTLRRLVGEGELGEVWRFESRFERWRPRVADGWRERAEPEEAGGVLFDLGSHLVDQALVLWGPVRSVYAELGARRESALVDDDAFVALAHDSGVRSHLWMSTAAADRGPRFRVLGSAAAFTKVGLDVQEAALREGRGPGEPEWGREPAQSWGSLGDDAEQRRIETVPGSYERFYEGVVATLRDGEPSPVDGEDAVRALVVLDAARESAREGRVVKIA